MRRPERAVPLAACRDPTEIRDLLFGSLIQAAVEGTPRTGHTRDYSEQNVNKWMQTLAFHLERRSDFSRGTQIALDEVWKLAGTRRCLALHPLVVGLVAGLVGLPVGLMVGVMVVLWPGLAVGLWVVPVSGLLAGLVVGLRCAYAVGLVVGINELQARIGGNLTKRAKWLAWRIPGAASKPGAPQRFAWRVPGRSRWRRGLAVGLASGLAFLLGSS